jgi:hypothetical protein
VTWSFCFGCATFDPELLHTAGTIIYRNSEMIAESSVCPKELPGVKNELNECR